MSNITSQELSLLRSRPHSTKLWLSIYKPRTILACQINDSNITHEEREITYNNVTDGIYTHVKSGMTMLVGSIAGARDIGRIRVRSVTSSVITVAENSHIDWEDDLYLTIINYFEIWSIFPYYVLDGGLVSWFKDFDVGYTNQNTTLGTFPCAGPHRAAFTGDQIYYSATGTYDVKSRGLSYDWFFEGGSVTGSSVETPGYITYNTPGHYRTTLTVDNGDGTDITHRHVSIYDRPEDGTNNPILRWEMSELSGNRDNGGYNVKITVHENVDDIVDGALVVLFADDIYDNTTQSIGGNYPNNSSIVFVGYILDDTIEYDYHHSTVEFEVVSVSEIMKSEEGSIVSLESVTSPSEWHEILDMDVHRFLYHYLRWHSTVLLSTDFRYVSANYKFQYQDVEPGSLYDIVNSFFMNSLFGRFVSDRQGLLWGEIEPQAINNATGSFSIGMSLSKQDWMGTPFIRENITPGLAYIELGGVAWSGASTGTSEAYLSGAPGNAHGYFGTGIEDHQGLILTSQNQLNTLSGNIFAYKNAKYPDIGLDITGNYRNLDLAPVEFHQITLFPDDTTRGITFINKEFYITDITWTYLSNIEILVPNITLHEVTQGHDGVTLEIPEPPVENIPSFPSFPSFPPFPLIPLPPVIPPIIWIPYPGECGITVEECVNDLTLPANSKQLWVRGEIRSDSLITDGKAPEINGYYADAIIRSAYHTNTTYVHILGAFEESSDYGVTWSELSDDSQWYIYALENYITKVELATVLVDDLVSGRGKKFLITGCRDLGPGGGIQIALNPCTPAGEAELSANRCNHGWALDENSVATCSFTGDNTINAFVSDPFIKSNKKTDIGYLFNILNAPALPVGGCRWTIRSLQWDKTYPDAAEARVSIGEAWICDGETPCITIQSDSNPPDIPDVGSVLIYDGGSSGPHDAGDVFASLYMRIQNATNTYPDTAYSETTVSLLIEKIEWIPSNSGLDSITLFSAVCENITRIRINEIYLKNICQ